MLSGREKLVFKPDVILQYKYGFSVILLLWDSRVSNTEVDLGCEFCVMYIQANHWNELRQ